MHKLVAFVGTAFVVAAALAAGPAEPPPFRLTIIHTNDNHGHQLPEPAGDGGDARQAAVVKKIRAEVPNSLLLDAGDRFTGTLLHTEYKGLNNVPTMNGLGFKAMAVGNHEFDQGDAGLAKFADAVRFPLLAANLDVSRSPDLAGKVKPYAVFEVGGKTVGVIGLVTADTKSTSQPSARVAFDPDYAGVVRRGVAELTGRGVSIVLVLSHIGLSEDRKLAAASAGVDAIVGGHSHTLLSNFYKEAAAEYPVTVKDAAGWPVPIVQAGGGDNRFLGRLDLEFDAEGRVTKAQGDTVHYSKYIDPDPAAAAAVAKLAAPIESLMRKPVVDKDGAPVSFDRELSDAKARAEEAALGDLVADAFRWKAKAQVALVGGGGLRDAIDPGPLTYGAVYRVLPFPNTLASYTLRGSDLLAALEHGLSRYGVSGNGRFLQVSGLRYTADVTLPEGKRLVRAEVRTADGSFARVEAAAAYKVASDSYVLSGGDDFTVLRDGAKDVNRDISSVQDAFVEYLATKPAVPTVGDRIKVTK